MPPVPPWRPPSSPSTRGSCRFPPDGRGRQQAKQNQVGLKPPLGIAIAYSAIGIASTFGMSACGRRSELALLHKTGAIRRPVV